MLTCQPAVSPALDPKPSSSQLGEGGNAEVFKATDSGGREVALKVIKAVKEEKEPYQRFIREIATLRGLTDLSGVLPVIDAYLPVKPTREDRPWLAMPIAQTLDEALRGTTLEEVVEAVAAVAQTLARLHDEGVGHRDVKPSNLYRLDGEALVGDFGLVAAPDTRGLTPDGRPLGPAHFMPYEMIANPNTADPKAADVYSLAKTLWVLASDQRFPPEGHQPAGTRGFEINDYRPHPNARLLDALIDRSTRIHPEARPSMREVASDLAKWLALPPETKAVDLGEIRSRFRAKMEATLAQEDIDEQRRDLAYAAIRRLTELVGPLNQALLDLHPRAKIDGQIFLGLDTSHGGDPRIRHPLVAEAVQRFVADPDRQMNHDLTLRCQQVSGRTGTSSSPRPRTRPVRVPRRCLLEGRRSTGRASAPRRGRSRSGCSGLVRSPRRRSLPARRARAGPRTVRTDHLRPYSVREGVLRDWLMDMTGTILGADEQPAEQDEQGAAEIAALRARREWIVQGVQSGFTKDEDVGPMLGNIDAEIARLSADDPTGLTFRLGFDWKLDDRTLNAQLRLVLAYVELDARFRPVAAVWTRQPVRGVEDDEGNPTPDRRAVQVEGGWRLTASELRRTHPASTRAGAATSP